MADTPHTKCSHCFQPASLQCSACKTHVYCHSECQRRNWSTHKILCKKARLELAVCRAADIFASIYFAFREKIFDRVIVKIEGKPGGLRVWEDDTAVKKSGWFAEFPDNLTEDPNVKAAVLFFQVCSEPYGYLKEVIDLLFEGLDIKIEEIEIRLKTPVPRSTTMVYADGRSYKNGINTLHSIMRITSTTSGKSWAVDVTGKQLGIDESCMAWTEYRTKYIKGIKSTYKLGKLQLFFKAAQNIPGYHTLNTSINFDAADCVVHTIRKWTSDAGLNFPKMLHLAQRSYEQKKTWLLDVVKETVHQFSDKADYNKLASDAELWEKNNPRFRMELEQILIDKVMPENSSIHFADSTDLALDRDGIHIFDFDDIDDKVMMEMLQRFPGAKIHSF